MTREELIGEVKVRLNELIPLGEGLEGLVAEEVTPVSTHIDKLLDESAFEVLRIIPPRHCPIKSVILQTPPEEPFNYVTLPDDYLKLVELKEEKWEVPVHGFLEPMGALYEMQQNMYVKGNVSRPKAFIKSTIINGYKVNIAELYSTDKSRNVRLDYVPITVAEGCKDETASAITWLCASKVLSISNRPEAKMAFENYTKEIQLLNL